MLDTIFFTALNYENTAFKTCLTTKIPPLKHALFIYENTAFKTCLTTKLPPFKTCLTTKISPSNHAYLG